MSTMYEMYVKTNEQVIHCLCLQETSSLLAKDANDTVML